MKTKESIRKIVGESAKAELGAGKPYVLNGEMPQELPSGGSNGGCSAEEQRRAVKSLYKVLINSELPGDPDSVSTRILLVKRLEKTLRTDFKDTRDFKDKIEAFLGGLDERRRPIPERIKRARIKGKLTQKQLADLLGYKSHVPVVQFERGKRNPSRRVLEWLEKTGM